MPINVGGPLRRLARATSTANERGDIERYERVRADLAMCADPIGDVFESAGGGITTTVATAAESASVPPEKAVLLYRLVRQLRPARVVEFGSALGMSGSCVVVALNANKTGRFVTVEGSPSRHKVAACSIASVDAEDRARTRCGMFDDMLDVLDDADMFFLDGNHYRDPTLRYVEAARRRMARPAVLVLDDVRWSEEMVEAWETLSRDDSFVASGEALGVGILLTDTVPGPLAPKVGDRARAVAARWRRLVRPRR